MTGAEWDAFHARWARSGPPLRVNQEVVAAYRAVVGAHAPVVLLGITPELALVADETIAVDWNAAMIAHVWPGDDEKRHSLLADWRDLPLPAGSCGAAMGDGSLNCLDWPAGYDQVFARLASVLRPGGPAAIRCYAMPDPNERLDAVADAAFAGRIAGFHALKWRLAMAAVGERNDPNLPVTEIHAAFDAHFPDRDRLAAAAGWSLEQIADIDFYAGSHVRYSFPTRDQILGCVGQGFTDARFEKSGSYELAERCPLLVLERGA